MKCLTIHRVLPLLVFAAAVGLASCELVGPEEAPADLRALSAAEKRLVASDNAFGLDLLRGLQAETPDDNLFISPVSVSFALGMTLNGAEGDTRRAMEEALGKAGLSEEAVNEAYRSLIDLLEGLDPRVVFEIANSIWYREGFDVRPEFLEANRTYFDAEVRELDFARSDAADVINGWVDEKTRGKIDEIVREIPPDVVMYLINAIYFNGTWTYEFDEEQTVDDVFRNADGTTSPIKMMVQEATLPLATTEAYRAVDLPYGDSLYSMTILLPEGGQTVNDLVDELDAAFWTDLTDRLAPKVVRIQLPRFSIEYETSLKKALSALGMGVAFSDAADFSGIRASGGLKISDVFHKTFVEVDEEGTEAAAVTVVVIVETSVGDGPALFRVDRPFVFAIRERHSGTLLFLGKVTGL